MPCAAHRLRRLVLPLLLVGPLAGGEADFARDVQPLLKAHCFDCHGDAKGKAGIDLAAYAAERDVHRDAGRWEVILRVLRDRSMPPEGKGELAEPERHRLTEWIAASLQRGYMAMPPDPGRVVLHRLSRREYNNTVRDLLGVDARPADRFPPDSGGGEGFDNNADTLFVPPLLMEKLVDAAEEVLVQAKPDRYIAQRPASKEPKAVMDAARASLLAFATRAWRRPVQPAEVDRLLRVFAALSQRGVGFDDCMRHCAKAVLSSPHFIYRVEYPRSAQGVYALDHHEIACRLSYFLWATMPDDELTALALEKKLHDETVIRAQVQRMLKDPRARTLGEGFAVQWLQLDNLQNGGGPDPGKFPLTPTLREAMAEEPAAFFNALVAQNRSVIQLLDSDWTWANQDLAELYGIPGVKGRELREVKHTDRRRGGVLGMAAVLATTSHPQRTSPVLRGRWVLDRILAAPPPPPPPITPTLPAEEPGKGATSLRAQLELHRKNPSCAGCHARIDPLGFALEGFDPLGRVRQRDGRGEALETTGTLPSGETVDGPEALRRALLARRDQFTTGFVEKLLGYALGRGIEPYDKRTVAEIARKAAADDWRAQTLITEICLSLPFRNARCGAAPVAPAAPPRGNP